LGACPVVPGGCTHPTGWWGLPNHRQLSREVIGTRDPTTARDIRCLHGAVGLGPGWRRASLQSCRARRGKNTLRTAMGAAGQTAGGGAGPAGRRG
jgi:hypothetical protein